MTTSQAYIEAEKEKSKVPPITDSLGKFWDQPNRHKILIGKTHATMSDKSFNALSEYSCSIPSGTYTGKMWKRRSSRGWKLAWYGAVRESDNTISIEYRIIINLKRT